MLYTCTRPLPGLDHLVHLLLQLQPLAPFSLQFLSQRIHVGLFSQLPQLFLCATTQNTEQHLQRPFADTSKGGFFFGASRCFCNKPQERNLRNTRIQVVVGIGRTGMFIARSPFDIFPIRRNRFRPSCSRSLDDFFHLHE